MNASISVIPGAPVQKRRTPIHIVIVATVVIVVVLPAILLGTVREEKEVLVIYQGRWAGSIGGERGGWDVNETGQHSYSLEGKDVLVRVHKDDGLTGELWVAIILHGAAVELTSATEPYGEVHIFHPFL